MKCLNIHAKFVMQRLYEAMYHEPYMQTEGSHAKISNSPEYMPVVIEKTGNLPGYGEIVSVAHYSLQNGDLMADPEMEFTVVVCYKRYGSKLFSKKSSISPTSLVFLHI